MAEITSGRKGLIGLIGYSSPWKEAKKGTRGLCFEQNQQRDTDYCLAPSSLRSPMFSCRCFVFEAKSLYGAVSGLALEIRLASNTQRSSS